MADFSGLWGFCGGWAIDLFLGWQTRAHKDVDLAILRRDQHLLYTYLTTRGWVLEIAHEGLLTPWDGTPLILPYHTLWCTHPQHEPSFLEVLFNEDDGTNLLFRRNTAVRMPLQVAFQPGLHRLPILAPEVVLLYKSKYHEDEDTHADFMNTVPHLSTQQQAWLHEALSQCYPTHEWQRYLEKPNSLPRRPS